MSEAQILGFVQRALEMREEGVPVDLQELCAEHPELVPAVAAALDMNVELPQALSQDPLIGTVMDGRYVLQDWIGAGAMGAVYASLDRSLDRLVAVKVLQQGILATEQRQQRFVREARVLASLNHPNIVQVFDHGLSDANFHYIVMERLVGASLSSVLEHQVTHGDEAEQPIWSVPGEMFVRLDWLSQVATWGVQLASALGAAHAAGVFHRDMKPSNVVVDSSGNAILLDFGIATREGEGSLTIGGTTLGTPWYMAPEQALDPSNVTPQVDVYGLCAALYHLVTYQPPYDGNYQQVLVKLQSEEPPPPHQLRSELPRDLCAIIEKGMERDPRRRYENAAALERDLRAFLTHMPVSARPLTAVGRRWRKIRARPMPWVASAVVLLLLIGSAYGAVAWQDAQRVQTAEQETEYIGLFAGWPPGIAFEGTPVTRRLQDPAERQMEIARAGRILSLRPDDVYSRMLRSALYLDHSDHAASAADVEYVARSAGTESEFFNALVQRYHDADRGTSGAAVIRLEDLPVPKTDLEHFVAAFHHARVKDYATADQLLAAAPQHVPARYLRLSVRLSTGGRPAPEDFAAVRAEAVALEAEFGFMTARTRYYEGLAARWLSDFTGAVRSYRESLALSESFGTLFNLAEVERKLRRLDAAITHYKAANRLRPWKMNAVLGLARVLAEFGEFDTALAMAQNVPTDGHLVEPWHRDYVLGVIESLRTKGAVGRGVDAEAQAGAMRARDHFRKSLELAGADGVGRARARAASREVELFLSDDPKLVSVLLASWRGDPLSEIHVRALINILDRYQLTDELRGELLHTLGSVADALERDRTGQSAAPRPMDASGRKK